MAASMILGAMLIVSIILAVAAWISRGNAIAALNDLQKKYDEKQTANVQETRTRHHKDVRMQTGVAPGCQRCQQLHRELMGAQAELRIAYGKMSDKQKDELYYNYDLVAKNVTLAYVADPANPSLQLLQISFSVKNQSTETRGNNLGLFKLYNEKEQVWQKEFSVPTLQKGGSTYVQIMAPGNIKWDGWYCNIYPSVPTGADGLPDRR